MEKCRGEVLKNETLTQEEEMKAWINTSQFETSVLYSGFFCYLNVSFRREVSSLSSSSTAFEKLGNEVPIPALPQTKKFSALHLPRRSQCKANSLILPSDLIQILLMTVDNAYLAADSSCLSAITWRRDRKIPRHLRRDISHCSWALRIAIPLRGVVVWYCWLLKNLRVIACSGTLNSLKIIVSCFGIFSE